MLRGETKKEAKKGGFVAGFFFWMLCMNLVLLKVDICSDSSED